MRYAYPVMLNRDEDGEYVATARDIPEALTSGKTEREALLEMSDALGAALAGYALEGRDLPTPSEPKSGEFLVPVAPLVAAKLILKETMRQGRITNTELAKRLGISEGAVRRLVNPDHASRLDKVVAALEALGHSLIVEGHRQDAA
jgi:antitoxin HicB